MIQITDTYWALVGLIASVDPHVYKKLVACIERAITTGTAAPEAIEILTSGFNMRLLHMADQGVLQNHFKWNPGSEFSKNKLLW